VVIGVSKLSRNMHFLTNIRNSFIRLFVNLKSSDLVLQLDDSESDMPRYIFYLLPSLAFFFLTVLFVLQFVSN
jgi:hypothetical protein